MTAATSFLVGLIGEGITASLTPPMHEREGRHLGFEYDYRTLDLLELGRAPGDVGALLAECRDAGYAALNVTHPCKQLVIPFLDELDPAAEHMGAVNLVLIRDGRFLGHNTDWTGFRSAVLAGLPDAPRDRIVQFGSGGAGSATAYALLTLGVAHLVIVDVLPERAQALVDRYAPLFPAQEVVAGTPQTLGSDLATADGVVHATPTGMKEHPGLPFDVTALAATAWVADIVYRPIDTELLAAARRRGHQVLDGGRMAVGQAADSIRLITGREPDAERMRAHFLELLGDDAALSAAATGGRA
ncbi:shikimate dehydrogenase [Cryobacterium melibiosiphilum]|uniref:Shikimate dehydrogenase n=1 Tax=Cryobacterium melibiosiphilum TaxID=995039 RepID=A0A3A5M851_9MICO|nr:shikimate dehydrogenase [Cryobacterium melibiosiphilum]RJT85133.1 shikimate dehydrogenase [Cryobacterium melibiosiphilum]